MSSTVTIKSIPNGIRVLLSPEPSFDEILTETIEKFKESKNFFKGGKLCVSFEGRKLSDSEENVMIETMENYGEFTVVYVVSVVDDDTLPITRAINKTNPEAEEQKRFCTVFKGSVKKGEHIKFTTGVVILGDVEPEGLVMAEGDVIIIGGLYGSVNIDTPEGSEPGLVAALDFSPSRIKIDDLRFYPKDKPKWTIKPKYQAKIAYVKDDLIEVKDINPANLKELANV